MDTQRLILFVIFSFSALFLWEAWQREHRPPVPVVATQPPGKTATDASVPSSAGSQATAPALPLAPGAVDPAGETIVIKTDLYVADVDTRGGVISSIALTSHRDTHDDTKPYLLLQRNAERTFLAQTGLLGEGLPNHRTLWEVLPGPHELAPGQDKLDIKLQATAANGDKVVQTLTFHRGSYVIDVTYNITNAGTAPISPHAYFQFTRDTKSQGVQGWGAPSSYTGPVIYNETDKYKKVDFSELDKEAADPARKTSYTKNSDNGWVGMVEHYFVAAWLPSDDSKMPREFYAKKVDNGLYADGVIVQASPIAPGATGEIKVPLYVGPQEQDTLKKLANGLDLVVDYGIFTILAAPLFWLLSGCTASSTIGDGRSCCSPSLSKACSTRSITPARVRWQK